MNQHNQQFHYDRQGLDFTEFSESSGGPRLRAYQDSRGIWTCGYGHTHGVGPDTTCTPEIADQWLQQDVAEAVYAVKFYVTIDLTQEQFDALVDLCFNIGSGNFAHSTLLSKINQKDFLGALAEFQKWDIAGGQILPGLRSRRQAEAALFTLGTDFTQQNPAIPATNSN